MALLNGITLGGRLLRVGRPADYKPPPPHLANYVAGQQIINTNALAGLTGLLAQATGGREGVAGLGAVGGLGTAQAAPANYNATVMMPTPVLVLLNMVTPAELIDDDEYHDIRTQVGQECEKFGSVVSVVIPRPNDAANNEDDDDDDDDDEDAGRSIPGVGRIFVRYETELQAKAARSKLHGRQFGGNTVEVRFYPVSKFEAKQYGE
uniref:RNA recognition motif domain-containing protein n=1 Tax=Lotharella oceanica TaxID=641309 RepID=A0A7S2TUG6_9EUKA